MERDSWCPIATTYNPLRAGSIDTTDKDPHDRGVVRAMNAKYRPNKDVVGNPEKTVFIARLNPKTTEDTIESKFSKYGDIERIRLVRDLVTGYSRCYAFVEYQSEKSAYRANKEADKMELEGCEIFVDFESERKLKGWIPRRLGGGLGGKKESGQLRFGGKDRPFRKPLDIENRLRAEYSARDRTRFQGDFRSRSEYRRDGRRPDRFENESAGKYQEGRERQRHSDREYSDSSQSGRSREDRNKHSYRDYSECRDTPGRSRKDRYRRSDKDYSETKDSSPARDRQRESDRDRADHHRSKHRRSRSRSRDR